MVDGKEVAIEDFRKAFSLNYVFTHFFHLRL